MLTEFTSCHLCIYGDWAQQQQQYSSIGQNSSSFRDNEREQAHQAPLGFGSPDEYVYDEATMQILYKRTRKPVPHLNNTAHSYQQYNMQYYTSQQFYVHPYEAEQYAAQNFDKTTTHPPNQNQPSDLTSSEPLPPHGKKNSLDVLAADKRRKSQKHASTNTKLKSKARAKSKSKSGTKSHYRKRARGSEESDGRSKLESNDHVDMKGESETKLEERLRVLEKLVDIYGMRMDGY